MLKTAIVGSASAQFLGTALTEGDQQFIRFVAKYGKTYASRAEFEARNAIFQEKLAFIEEHNSTNEEGHTVAVNAFTDLTDAEWANMRGYKSAGLNAAYADFSGVELDDEVNWYEKGMVNEPKDQKQCGSCWAFSAVGAVESADAIASGDLKSFAEQQLVDCDKATGNMGCNGGDMALAFEYVEKNALDLEADYKYTGRDGTCAASGSGVGTVSSYVNVTPNSEDQLKGALMKGPVSVAIEADQLAFQLYHGGVIKRGCGTNLDHGVLAVGYGTEDGTDYYLVKNSWGASWGDKGFVKIAAESSGSGMCGIQMDPSQPSA